MTNDTFIGNSISEMITHGISVKFIKRKNESRNSGCTFTPPPYSEMVINYFYNQMNDEWIYNFIHEFCHFIQWRDENHIWGPYDKYSSKFEEYFINKKQKTLSENIVKKIQEIEIDGGLKAHKLITDNELAIDLDRYFVNNNLYILCYPSMVKYKKFIIPYEFTDNIDELIPREPVTIDVVSNYGYYNEIDSCYAQRFGKKKL